MASVRSFSSLARISARQSFNLKSNIRLSAIRRNYTTPPKTDGGFSPLLWIGCLSLGVAYTHYQNKRAVKTDENQINNHSSSDKKETPDLKETPTNKPDDSKKTDSEKSIDYQAVYNDIAELLDSDSEFDDGSFGPILLRLAWHSSGTYTKDDGSGGSNGGTMRFKTESSYSANNGLAIARDLLETHIKQKYPELSYGDMYTLGGVVAVQELGGPDIKWRPGRRDQGENTSTPDGRLPSGSKDSNHARDIFYRMGFNDQEIVALIGGHTLGRCHLDRSGFEGPWHEAPTFFSNGYYKALKHREWVKRDLPNGGWQWVDKKNPEVMMLPIEIAMYHDEKFRPYYELYANDTAKFYEDFAAVFKKLIELGVPFKGDEKEYVFERLNI